jgi:hypothetical protein
MLLLLVPLSMLALIGLLLLADALERMSPRVLVRFTLRSQASPDTAEHVISAELAKVLAANGLDTRVSTGR